MYGLVVRYGPQSVAQEDPFPLQKKSEEEASICEYSNDLDDQLLNHSLQENSQPRRLPRQMPMFRVTGRAKETERRSVRGFERLSRAFISSSQRP